MRGCWAVVVILGLMAQAHAQARAPVGPGSAEDVAATAIAPGLLDAAELAYSGRSIVLDSSFAVGRGAATQLSTRRNWRAYQGGSGELLSPTQFYTAVGRPELAASYDQRHWFGLATLVGGAALVLGTVGYGSATIDSCDAVALDERRGCSDRYHRVLEVGVGVGLIAMAIGGWYVGRPHPIDESQAQALVDDYNRRLRRQIGLPIVARPPVLRDLKVGAYRDGRSSGLVIAARF